MNKFFKKATLLDFVKSRYGGAAIGAAFSGISTYSLMRLLKASKESRIAATIGATIIGAGVGREIGKRYEKPIKIELKKLKQQDIADVAKSIYNGGSFISASCGGNNKSKFPKTFAEIKEALPPIIQQHWAGNDKFTDGFTEADDIGIRWDILPDDHFTVYPKQGYTGETYTGNFGN